MKTAIFGLLGLLMIGVVVAGSATAFRFWLGPQDSEAVQTAIENNDYDAWKAAIEDKLTQENFDKLVEQHNTMTQLRENRQAVTDAIEAHDYDAWVAAIGDSPNAENLKEVITADNFGRYVEMYEAKQSGDFETAKTIADELGIDQLCPGMGLGFGRHMFRGH